MISKISNNLLAIDFVNFLNRNNFKNVYKIYKTNNGYSYKYIKGKT